jgi:hypothetical protein
MKKDALIPNCGDIDSSALRPRPSKAPISHWTTLRFCNECPSGGVRSMSQGLRVLVLAGIAALFGACIVRSSWR